MYVPEWSSNQNTDTAPRSRETRADGGARVDLRLRPSFLRRLGARPVLPAISGSSGDILPLARLDVPHVEDNEQP
jgi:hypothetical protein